MPYSISPAANGTVSIKTTSTGAIDTCFTRFDSKNERLWSSNNHNQLAFGDKQANTFRWMVAEVETAYAEQAACPEKTVDMPAVDDSIAGFILGDISKNHPEYNQVAHNAYVKGKAAGFAVGSAFEIDLESPEARRAAAAGRFDKKLSEIEGMKHTLPGTDGQTAPIARPKISVLAVNGCHVTPMSIGGR